MEEPTTPRILGDGLALRWSKAADTEAIAELVGHVFRDRPEDGPNPLPSAYARTLMSGRSPIMTPNDFAVVEETAGDGRIVACACLLAQTWRYGSVVFKVGRPELVATHPDFRRRGLIRAIFAALHARSSARGDLAQAITGIEYFYRQFGYEYALELGGGRVSYFTIVPEAKPDAPDLYRLRRAEAADVPFLSTLYERACTRSLVSAEIGPGYWRYKLSSAPTSDEDWAIHLIVDSAGSPRGYVSVEPFRLGPRLAVHQAETTAGLNLRAVAVPLLRALRDLAPTIQTTKPMEPPVGVTFILGTAHPLFEALGDVLPMVHRPYAWYVRVPDLPGFLMRLAPVLNERLAGSVVAGHSGALNLNFHRGGLRLTFEHGQLRRAEHWERGMWEEDHAGFPPLVFLQLLFGYRSLDELRGMYPDVHCSDDAEPLLKALFPKAFSNVLPLD